MNRLTYWFLRMERAYHLVDAYLYANQGKMMHRTDALSRAYECERLISRLEINA